MRAATSPFPLRVAVVFSANGDSDLAFFDAGERVDALAGGVELLLHPATDARATHALQSAGALCVPWERALDLLAPERQRRPPDAADEVAAAYFAAIRSYRVDAETLQLALHALPESAVAEQRLLRSGVAIATAQALAGRERATTRDAPASGPLHADGWRSRDVHALLDACFEHLRAWRTARSGRAFEARAGQVQMAHAVLDAMLHSDTLVVEAGTGIGKTLAYALPSILIAALHNRRVVLSTHTRNLQQQLVEHDLPQLWESLGLGRVTVREGEHGLRYAMLLGRNNYYCRTALRRWLEKEIDAGGGLRAAQIILATLRSRDGVLEGLLPDLDPAIWRQICSRRESCVGRGCRTALPCPVHVARETARRAHVAVVNHALLLADARSGGNILGTWDALVVDESHNLKRVATDAFGLRLGRSQVEALAAPSARLEHELRALAPEAGEDELERWLERFEPLRPQWTELRKRLLAWLTALDAALPQTGRVPARQRYRDGDEVFGAVREEFEVLRHDLEQVTRELVALARGFPEELRDMPGADETLEILELVLELFFETSTALEFVVRGDDEDWAFYLDFSAEERALHEIVAAPLDVADEIQGALGKAGQAVVYTSATLAVGDDAGYFRRGIGVPSETQVLHIESPFDYARQCLITHTASLGHHNDPDFSPQVAEIVSDLQRRTGRRQLVLLTSYAALRRLHQELLEQLGRDASILAQDVSGSRSRLASRFAATPGAVLLGTDSFWEGVDFPGEALEILLMTKLPFVVPNEPLVAARSERLRARGEDPFNDFVLPEALLRFRQGFGRLIRSQADRGAVILLDARLELRDYGDSFQAVLPAPVRSFEGARELVDAVVEWFD